MNKLFKNMIIGATSGIAFAYFWSTKNGKKWHKKAIKVYQSYQKNPDEYHQKAKEKATEYTNLAVDTFNDYRQKFESGELTTDEFLDTVKEKGKVLADFTSDKISELTSKVSSVKESEVSRETKAEVDDIIIDYTSKEEQDTTNNINEDN